MERFGTRHKAALGMTEQTDALVVVVSEESGQMSLVERARIVRNLDEPKLARMLTTYLHPDRTGRQLFGETGRRAARPGIVRDLARRARASRSHRDEAARTDRRPARTDEEPRARASR